MPDTLDDDTLDALANVALYAVQHTIGVTDGGVAAMHYADTEAPEGADTDAVASSGVAPSGAGPWQELRANLLSYLRTEHAFADEDGRPFYEGSPPKGKPSAPCFDDTLGGFVSPGLLAEVEGYLDTMHTDGMEDALDKALDLLRRVAS